MVLVYNIQCQHWYTDICYLIDTDIYQYQYFKNEQILTNTNTSAQSLIVSKRVKTMQCLIDPAFFDRCD